MEKLIQIGSAPASRNARPAAGKKIGWISLGCPKNLVDSEGMLGDLGAAGYTLTPDLAEADAVVVNTCGFIEAARDESLAALRESLGTNARGARRKVVAVGCLAQRLGAELFTRVEGLDAVVGMGQQAELAGVLAAALGEETGAAPQLQVFHPTHYFPRVERRLQLTAPWTAYVKISDGCDNPCTFCSIPLMRGKLRSRPAGEIEDEVRLLADRGVQEIVLIAQDSTHYGSDLHESGTSDVAGLLRRLARIDGPRWIRLMYAYPTRVNDRLLDVIAGEPRICKYIDMPLQHTSDPVLAAMKRPGTAASYRKLLAHIRQRCPEITIRTTMILGFPGETEANFQHLLDFVEDARFDRLGAFRYSPEPGTPAALLDSAIPGRVVDRRYDRLMRLQHRISLERSREWIGRTMPVLVESVHPDGTAVGRSERDAPDIDGQVKITAAGSTASGTPISNAFVPGTFVNVAVTGAAPYDLSGYVVPDSVPALRRETVCQRL